MGTYYSYVNFTRKEYFESSLLRAGGSKENAVIESAVALSWLMLWPTDDGYRGRWHAPVRGLSSGAPQGSSQDIRIVGDGAMDFDAFDYYEYLNISFGLLQSMRDAEMPQVTDWKPRHDVKVVQRVRSGPWGSPALADAVSAACSCGWKCARIYGDDRERMLELALSAHASDC